MECISDNIREDISEEISYLISKYRKVKIDYVRKIIDEMDKDKTSTINRYKVDNNLVIIRNTKDILKRQMYTDYYRILKYKDVLGGEKNSFIIRPNEKQINDLYENNTVLAGMIYSMNNMYLSSNIERILINKCLNEDDVNYLKRINPFFLIEYDKYNKKIDLEMLQRLMSELNDEYNPDFKYNMSSYFIFILNDIDKEETNNLLMEFFKNYKGIDIINPPYNPNEEHIKWGQIDLTIDSLGYMLKKHFESVKKLKYKKDDNDGSK